MASRQPDIPHGRAVARLTSLCRWAIGLSCALVVLNQLVSGRLTDYLIVEDGPIENLTAISFLAAAAIAAAGWRRARDDAFAPVSLALTILASVAFLDELSFGQRMFGWTAPLWHDTYIDAVHDFFEVGYKVLREQLTGPQTAAVMGTSIIMCCATVFAFRRRFAIFGLSAAAPFIVVAVCFMAVSLILDLEFIGPEFQFALSPSLEEVFELSAGWALLGGSLVRWIEISSRLL